MKRAADFAADVFTGDNVDMPKVAQQEHDFRKGRFAKRHTTLGFQGFLDGQASCWCFLSRQVAEFGTAECRSPGAEIGLGR